MAPIRVVAEVENHEARRWPGKRVRLEVISKRVPNIVQGSGAGILEVAAIDHVATVLTGGRA